MTWRDRAFNCDLNPSTPHQVAGKVQALHAEAFHLKLALDKATVLNPKGHRRRLFLMSEVPL